MWPECAITPLQEVASQAEAEREFAGEIPSATRDLVFTLFGEYLVALPGIEPGFED